MSIIKTTLANSFEPFSLTYPEQESVSLVGSNNLIKDNQSDINSLGILICGTGIGMSIASNKFKHIRSALIYDINTAEMCKKHNNANIICLGARTLDFNNAINLINKFIDTEFEGDRHIKRLKKIESYNI